MPPQPGKTTRRIYRITIFFHTQRENRGTRRRHRALGRLWVNIRPTTPLLFSSQVHVSRHAWNEGRRILTFSDRNGFNLLGLQRQRIGMYRVRRHAKHLSELVRFTVCLHPPIARVLLHGHSRQGREAPARDALSNYDSMRMLRSLQPPTDPAATQSPSGKSKT